QSQLDTLTAEEHALVSSAAWSSVAEIETLRELADTQARAAATARRHADDATAAAGALEAELITARAAAAERRDRASSELDSLLELAAAAGLERRATMLADQLRKGALAADTWSPLLRELATDWRDVLHRHRELMRELRRAAADAERARAGEREAAGRLEQAAAKREACGQQLEEARAAFTSAFERWRSALAQLELEEHAVEAALELASEGDSPMPALAAAVHRRRVLLSDERASHVSARSAAATAVAATEAEIERLASAHDDGPRAPDWLRADRAERSGAPLWRLIDFRADVPAERRTALEAGLEAAGLLDSWVTPSGCIEDPAIADVVFAGAEPADGQSLLHVLEPVPDQPVTPDVVRRLLASVGLAERETGSWVGIDGRFVIGPLRGLGAKNRAEHIGATAREARRAARIAELREEIATLETGIAQHEALIAGVDRRREALEADLRALPGVDAVRSAIDAVRVSTALESEAERGYERAAGAARSAADVELAAASANREHAVAHVLSHTLDEPALDALGDATAQLTGTCGAVAHAWTMAERETQGAHTVATKLSDAHEATSESDQRARDEEAEASRLSAEHAVREQALGVTGIELRRRHERVVTALKATRDELRHTSESAQHVAVAVARLERDEGSRQLEHESVRGQRERASISFRQLAQAGILRLVLGEGTPADTNYGAGWTFTRTLEVVRALPPELLSVRSTSGELGIEVQRGVQLLDRELADADMGAYARRGEDDLLLVHVTEGGGEQTLGEVLETLEAEIADREQILTTEERRVFSDALVEEIADHLRHRVHDVRSRIERMNAVLLRSPTAAGKTVELEWEPLDDEAGTQRAALARLRRDVRHLREEDRAELVAFFRGRIESARREHTFGGEPKPMAETLMEAFDYRTWFAFTLHERMGANRVRLTKRRHAVGSGGEQSVLIHLPLFAAAAALYGDSESPRLIVLDEALSGIDDETRERVLEATVAFDLDVAMTSHELWGTYRSV
ncbi:MAG: SbcC/MukB-like Walker B domain-containing protein, partial [Solirubrobacteraceae bacterium]